MTKTSKTVYRLYCTDRSCDSVGGGASAVFKKQTSDKDEVIKFYANETYNPYACKEVKVLPSNAESYWIFNVSDFDLIK